MSRRQALLARLAQRRRDGPLAGDFYCGAEAFEADLDLIWYREWLFAGHDGELASPGDYLTLQVGAYPILIIRGNDGEVRAFHNTCRHRGSRLCSAAHGHSPRIVCPYHAWTYRLDGSLLSARGRDPGDSRGEGLKALHCRNFAGFIWISLATDPPDFTAPRGLAEPYLAPHRLGDAKVAFESSIVEAANWKLVVENNRECLHCAANHPELLRSFSDAPTVTSAVGAASDPLVDGAWKAWEEQGLPSRYRVSPDFQTRVMRLPLQGGAQSMTRDGGCAVRRALAPPLRVDPPGSLLFYHYPSTWNHVLGDHAVTFRILPAGPAATQLTTRWLVHRDAVEGVDYDLEDLTAVWRATNAADQRICQENQLGVQSPAYVPGPYSSVYEAGVKQFMDWYCATLEGRLRADAL